MKPTQNNVLLELHVPDFEKVKNYYGKLGFNVVWERKPEGFKGYMILKMLDNILCFWAGNDSIYKHPFFKKYPKGTPMGNGVEIVVMIDDIDKYYEKVKSFANVVEELTMQPWGLKDFRTQDPYGYYLRFTSCHDILDNGNAVP